MLVTELIRRGALYHGDRMVLRDGESGDEAGSIAHAHGSLAGYKAPKALRFLESIPLSPAGKPLRRVLREPFRQGKERPI